jgi:hypothetical protein
MVRKPAARNVSKRREIVKSYRRMFPSFGAPERNSGAGVFNYIRIQETLK